ncbi:TPA: hypothetical protein U1X82_000570 [Streptococcus suis]|nr:hypothetical protein [Streptococcus suis]HEM4275843.1 hypothetical protein [Streptococcus suis]
MTENINPLTLQNRLQRLEMVAIRKIGRFFSSNNYCEFLGKDGVLLNSEELTKFLLDKTEEDLRLIYHFGLEEGDTEKEIVSFVRGRVRGYCSAVFALLLKLRSSQHDVNVSDAIHDLIKLREHAEKKIEEYLSNK